ncbi:MAG: MEDS domain-containing protein [Acidobacteriota bacterium]
MTMPTTLPTASWPAQPLPPFLNKWTLPNPQVASCKNHDHFAIIYDRPDEQLDFIVPFLRLGLERGEKSVFIYDDNSPETVIAAMERHGIDVTAAASCGALSIITKRHAYLKNGDFDPDWMIDFLAQAVEEAKKEGFSAVRASGEMTWALGPAGDAHSRLVEYECKLDKFFAGYDMSGICQYNRRRFRPQTLMHVIHTHSRVVFRGELCENPYYIPPEILEGRGGDFNGAVLRLLESMAENSRLRRQLAEGTEALRQSEKFAVAARMASILAHEVNNPLEAILNTCFLLEHQELPPRARAYLTDMSQQLERVCDISSRTLQAFRDADLPKPH